MTKEKDLKKVQKEENLTRGDKGEAHRKLGSVIKNNRNKKNNQNKSNHFKGVSSPNAHSVTKKIKVALKTGIGMLLANSILLLGLLLVKAKTNRTAFDSK